MIFSLFAKKRSSDVPPALYAAIVEQARQPEFFLHIGFPDTVTGRFDCLALHQFLLSRRLVAEPHPHAQSLNQEVFDQFVRGTDRALRELGVGDTSVAKRNKKLLRGFYAIVDEFGGPLEAGDEALLTGKVSSRFALMDGSASAMAHYLLTCSKNLAGQDIEAILSGRLDWPDPPKSRTPRKKQAT